MRGSVAREPEASQTHREGVGTTPSGSSITGRYRAATRPRRGASAAAGTASAPRAPRGIVARRGERKGTEWRHHRCARGGRPLESKSPVQHTVHGASETSTMFGRRKTPAEVLTLPSPANELWLRTEAAIGQELRRAGNHRLGGGSLLAARWGHRSSLDIDLTIKPRGRHPQRIDWLTAPGSTFHKRMTQLGTSRATAPSRHQIRVYFEDAKLDIAILERAEQRHRPSRHQIRVYFEDAKLDIAILDGWNHHTGSGAGLGERKAVHGAINDPGARRKAGTISRTASARRLRPPTVGAGRNDPSSLAKAVNRVDRRGIREIIKRWKTTSTRWASEAPGQLRSLVPRYSYDPATLGRETAEALRDALYQRVRITTHGREGTVEAETVGGTITTHGREGTVEAETAAAPK